MSALHLIPQTQYDKRYVVGLSSLIPRGAVMLYPSAVEGSPGSGLAVSVTPAVTRAAYLTKAIITSTSPTNQQSGIVTISDGVWTLNFTFVESVSAGGCLVLPFESHPLVATAINTPIVITVPAIGSGGTVAVAATGYEL